MSLAAVPVLLAGPGAAAVRVRELYLMGTRARVEVTARDGAVAARAAEAAVRALERAERELSTWREDTALARLNGAPAGVRVPLPERVAAELDRALELARRTGGAFDPVVGALTAAWGLRGRGRVPSARELAVARARSGWRRIRIGRSWALREASGVVVDEGGWGKGAALDRVVEAAAAAGARRGTIDLGGQVAAWGGELTVAVADPVRRERPVVQLRLPEGSVATSGNGERAVRAADRRIGHLLDPRTGRPAADFGSVTVWARSALEADALATALFVMGPEAGRRWAEREPGVEALYLVRREGGLTVWTTSGLVDRLELLAADVELGRGASGPGTEMRRPGGR